MYFNINTLLCNYNVYIFLSVWVSVCVCANVIKCYHSYDYSDTAYEMAMTMKWFY